MTRAETVDLEDKAPTNLPTTSSDEQKVSWLELFFDLAFVVTFDQLAKRLGDNPNWFNLGLFGLLFVLVWLTWSGNATFSARFGNEGRRYRWGTVLQILTVGMLALGVRGDLDETGWLVALFFAANHAVLLLMYWYVGYKEPQSTPVTRPLTLIYAVVTVLLLISAALEGPFRLGTWAFAAALNIFAPFWLGQRHQVAMPHQAHLPERIGLLQIVAMGSLLTEIVGGARQSELNAEGLVPALSAMVLSIAIWRIYFDQARSLPLLIAHYAGQVKTMLIWLFSHLPLTLSLMTLAVGLGHSLSAHAGAEYRNILAFIAWPLAGVFLSVFGLRLNALHILRRSARRDRSSWALVLGAVFSALLVRWPMPPLPFHLATTALGLIVSFIVATDPLTATLGRVEEKLEQQAEADKAD